MLQDNASFLQQFEAAAKKEVEIVEKVVEKVVQDPQLQSRLEALEKDNTKLKEQVRWGDGLTVVFHLLISCTSFLHHFLFDFLSAISSKVEYYWNIQIYIFFSL